MGAGGAVRGICQVHEISGQPSWYRGLDCCKGKAELGLQVEEVGRGLPAGGQYFQNLGPFGSRGRQTLRIWGHSSEWTTAPRKMHSTPFYSCACLTVKTMLYML